MKAVFFDFDGTLTYKSKNIWKAIWQKLGYDTSKSSYFAQLFVDFMNKKITHQQWCDLTCSAFQEKGMNVNILNELVKEIKLIDGATELFEILKQNGFSLHVVSGNIIDVIEKVLGENVKYFDSINANDFYFDNENKLTYIKGTNYDFEGKAKFIEQYKETFGTPAKNLYFVGNGDNDEWAYLSGCHTICINPENAETSNKSKWHTTIDNVNDLRDVLPFIIDKKELKENNERKF